MSKSNGKTVKLIRVELLCEVVKDQHTNPHHSRKGDTEPYVFIPIGTKGTIKNVSSRESGSMAVNIVWDAVMIGNEVKVDYEYPVRAGEIRAV